MNNQVFNNKKLSWLTTLINQDTPLKIYVCGPTVYDDIHIGNLRSVIVFDILIRYLKECKKEYTYVHNITDIDDKIINKSLEAGCSHKDISIKYTAEYISILEKMNVIMPCHLPTVTESIPMIISELESMEKRKHAYFKNNNLCFDISKFPEQYLQISNQKLEQLSSEELDETNFTLWKSTSKGPTWNSSWGPGRPGWHVECFCFIKKFFNGPVDIHGGGIDLKFPHHENENIISHSCFGEGISKHWLHVGKVSYKGEKLSKSSGNKMFLVKDLLQTYHPNILRYFFFSTGFSKPILMDDETMDKCKCDFDSLITSINHIKTQLFYHNENMELGFFEYPTDHEKKFLKDILSLVETLSFPDIVSFLMDIKNIMINLFSEFYKQNKPVDKSKISTQDLESHNKKIDTLNNNIKTNIQKMFVILKWLGFIVENIHNKDNIQKIKNMKTFRDNKQYLESDKIRSELQAIGLLMK